MTLDYNEHAYLRFIEGGWILLILSMNRPNRLRFVLPISTHVTIPLGSLNLPYFLYTWHNFAWREICRRNQKIFYQEIDHMT